MHVAWRFRVLLEIRILLWQRATRSQYFFYSSFWDDSSLWDARPLKVGDTRVSGETTCSKNGCWTLRATKHSMESARF